MEFANEKSYYSIKNQKKWHFRLLETKLTEKIPNLCNAKKHYESFLRKNMQSWQNNQRELPINQNLQKVQTLFIQNQLLQNTQKLLISYVRL